MYFFLFQSQIFKLVAFEKFIIIMYGILADSMNKFIS